MAASCTDAIEDAGRIGEKMPALAARAPCTPRRDANALSEAAERDAYMLRFSSCTKKPVENVQKHDI